MATSYSQILEAVQAGIISAQGCSIPYDAVTIEARISDFVTQVANSWVSANILIAPTRAKRIETGGFVTAGVRIDIDLVKMPTSGEYDYIAALESLLADASILESTFTDNTLGGVCLNSRPVTLAEITDYTPAKAVRLEVEFERQWRS